ncbi:MAG TPA: hypothetical protein VF292_13695 [Rhodanobacteraceae bacterium]
MDTSGRAQHKLTTVRYPHHPGIKTATAYRLPDRLRGGVVTDRYPQRGGWKPQAWIICTYQRRAISRKCAMGRSPHLDIDNLTREVQLSLCPMAEIGDHGRLQQTHHAREVDQVDERRR